ncbi:Gfo/Idh/MocA family protein [Vibrio coralliilyticus]|uniref:Gfo/Idh/MocA family protein n=1 Tax=Vibrio coralliilyticus TaxID=190893 RepID=UPI00155FF9DE|nr:Gfo/Idh/MocA family oxidoreductase [Vibrio coralliilyticus]NRF33149.1 Gfo/Idh/MocA family oxidoreductase [Vibrio coralliilyticus]NRF55668.1 Gfo/Idh/MocA family oxidoreductase [Vibrio coralliilyticus]
MYKVKVFGAGSIGNHLSYACRSKGWEVTICDTDSDALLRTKEDIYPSRYGRWDESINLIDASQRDDSQYDLVIIGTPPQTHSAIALDVLKNNPPKVILIEKPMLTPDLKDAQDLFRLSQEKGVVITVGYNHTLTQNTVEAERLLQNNIIGNALTISSMTREHWGGIFGAHPWLNGPSDTYLGYWEQGGGACGEHSHAINIWQHFAHVLGKGRITKVSAKMNFVSDGDAMYDDMCFLNVETESGFVGNIVQDVITEPTRKNLRIQGDNGFMEWHVGYKGGDALIYSNGTEQTEMLIEKTRPDDFKGEIEHLENILNGQLEKISPVSMERGLDTMMVIAAAFKSHFENREVTIDYSKGYTLDALI